MILNGSQRAGSIQLAQHLMKTQDNEHVEIHDLRGFVADNLFGAFREAHAISKGTKCTQFLFSLSLNPPENETVPVDVFEAAIAEIESRMGLTDQPRAIVFHEKHGRRHAHCVWSRIDADEMKAINLPHFKFKLRDISRELFLEHGWHMPRGLMNSAERDPLNYTLAEWQQAKRVEQDPRVLKQIFLDCWAVSDSKSAFANALQERGFYLAQGDRRGHVAVDWRGEIFAISRWVGVKAKELRARLGDTDDLPTVDKTKALIGERFTAKLKEFCAVEESRHMQKQKILDNTRLKLVATHRKKRQALQKNQNQKQVSETRVRAVRLPKGLKALWFRVTGKYRKICAKNERQFRDCKDRDREERQQLIDRQLRERRYLQHEIRQNRHHHAIATTKLSRDIAAYLKLSQQAQEEALLCAPSQKRRRRRIREPT